MRKILFSLFATAALCATDVMKAQTVLFEDSFETYTDFAIANVGNWTLTDVDLKTDLRLYGHYFSQYRRCKILPGFQLNYDYSADDSYCNFKLDR